MDFIGEGQVLQTYPALSSFNEEMQRLPQFGEFWADPECLDRHHLKFHNKHAKINN